VDDVVRLNPHALEQAEKLPPFFVHANKHWL